MENLTFTLEVFYKSGPENTVDNLDRVEYGLGKQKTAYVPLYPNWVCLAVG